MRVSIGRFSFWQRLAPCRTSFLLFVFALGIRVIYSNLFMTGGDMPSHAMASMRLHLAKLWSLEFFYQNFFVQIIKFVHGYTTLLIPFLGYEFLFNFLGLKITESTLLWFHSLMGVAALFAVKFFSAQAFDRKSSHWIFLLVAVAPVHVGLSRAHAGTPILQNLTFYLSLGFLYLLVKRQGRWDRWGYVAATILYIGADNAFFIGLFLHLVFVLCLAEIESASGAWVAVRRVWGRPLTLIPILLPVLAYITVDFVDRFYLRGPNATGYLLRLFSKGESQAMTLDLVKPFVWGLELLGPLFVFGCVALVASFRGFVKEPAMRFLLIVFGLYLLLMIISNRVERNYVFFLLVPIAVFCVRTWIGRPLILFAAVASTLAYSLGVVYNLPLGFETRYNFGSINRFVPNNDYGLKTLGYLVRKGLIDVSKDQIISGKARFDQLGLFMDVEGAWYYLGDGYNDWVKYSIDKGKLSDYPVYVFVVRKFNFGVPDPLNDYLSDQAAKLNLSKIGTIFNGDLPLLEIFSNKPAEGGPKRYDVRDYNPLFDKEFGNLNVITKMHLGQI